VNGKGGHLAECLFQSRECPFKKLSGGGCAWNGTLSDIAVHITDKHCSETAEVQEHFKVKLLDLSRGKRYHQVVLFMGELFYLTWEITEDAFSFGVFYFGPKKETEALKYGIEIGNSEEQVTVTRKCHSYVEGGLKDLQPEKYVKLYYNTLQNCLSESTDLWCEIEIGREKLDGFVLEELQECLKAVGIICVGWDSADDTVTRDGLGAQKNKNVFKQRSRHLSRPFLGPTQPPVQREPDLLWATQAGTGTDNPPHLTPKLNKE